MGYEVEVKYRVADGAALVEALRRLGAAAGAAVEQEDLYLAHPARDFARTGEALRLRRDGPRHAITYKGPRRDGPTKTREEREVAFAGGEESFVGMRAIFESLGFRPV